MTETAVERLKLLIAKCQLEHLESQILAGVKPSLRILLAAKAVPGTSSRLGGPPQLPGADQWPRDAGGHLLGFIGQVTLADVHKAMPKSPLPPSGALSFFYDVENQPSGVYSEFTGGGWRVLYFPDVSALREITPSEPEPESLQHCPINFIPELTIPAFRSIEIDNLKLDENDDWDRYSELRDALARESSGSRPIHRLMGHPDSIQGCMQRGVQFKSRNEALPAGVYSYYEHPRAAELIPGAHDWQLLLQVDSDDQLETLWGDGGRIYFWIHRDDLAALDFSRVWTFLQEY